MFKRMKYIGKKNSCGFIRNHEYDCKIISREDAPGIVVISDFDVTEDVEVDLYMPFGSQLGIKFFFKELS